jgi:hypothetical protein
VSSYEERPTADAETEESDLNQWNQKLKNEKSKAKVSEGEEEGEEQNAFVDIYPMFRLITVRSLIINA